METKNTKPTLAEVTPEVIAAWKAKYGKVFQFKSEDGVCTGFFKSPDRTVMDAVSAIAKSNPVKSNEMLAKSCFLGGDETLITKDDYFFGLSQKLTTLLEIKQGELTEL